MPNSQFATSNKIFRNTDGFAVGGGRRAAAKTAMSIAAVEFGGTKTMVTVGDLAGHHLPPVRLPSGTPEETVQLVVSTLRGLKTGSAPYGAIGVASFGPLQLDPRAPQYGHILNTPKSGWGGFDMVGALRRAFDAPIVLETDVNAAALGEMRYSASGCSDYAYITVGTGIGVGLVSGGLPVHGRGHSEAGHIVVRQRHDDDFKGLCFAHGTCLEGLISGPALEARTGGELSKLSMAHWDLAGDYLAQLCLSLVLIAAPQRIVLGGRVGSRTELLAATRLHLWRQLGGYIDYYQDQESVDELLVTAALEHSGLLGALAMAGARALNYQL
jgi:fructokinase